MLSRIHSAVVFLLLLSLLDQARAACPANFTASTSVPGKCYLHTTSDGFTHAVQTCRRLVKGADILAIGNGFENAEIASLLQTTWKISNAFTGNIFYDNAPHWLAYAARNSTYSNWIEGNFNGDYAFIGPTGAWDPVDIYSFRDVVCQIYPDDASTFPPPEPNCPSGWSASMSVQGKCYRYSPGSSQFDFFEATRQCLSTKGSELLTTSSQLELIETWETASGLPWTALARYEDGQNWRWIETTHPTNYTGLSKLPIGTNGNCSCTTASALFSFLCAEQNCYICQYFPNETAPPTLASLSCPQNGIASVTNPGTCYYVLNQTSGFDAARAGCKALSTGFKNNDLFVPRNPAELEEFQAIVQNQNVVSPYVWIGLTNTNGSSWAWVAQRDSPFSSHWCSGQPDNAQYPNDRCALVIADPSAFCWMAGDCTDNTRVAVCQSSNTF